MAETLLQRASSFALKKETVTGELIAPSVGSDFIPLRSGAFSMTPNVEILESDELVNDIGKTKGALGKQSPEGSHGAYIKHSDVEGQEPEVGVMYESAFGAKTVNATEYDVVAGSVAGSDSVRASLEMTPGEEDNFELGQAVLIKDGANGYSIRNVYNVDSAGDQLDLNFNLSAAPAAGVLLGKAVLYKPAATGHPSYSAWMHTASDGVIQAMAGCRTSSISMTYTAGQQAEVELSYGGSAMYMNPVIIDGTNKGLSITDTGGVVALTLSEGVYRTPIAFAEHLASVMTAGSVDTITAVYSNTTGKYTFVSDAAVTFAIDSGTALSLLGFSVPQTGALTYTSSTAIVIAPVVTPAFDGADNIVVKNAVLMLGDYSDNFCREAQEVSISIETPLTDVDEICAETGLKEKLILERTVTATATLILPRYDVQLFDKFLRNETLAAMINIGQKSSAGNWIAGRNVNLCFLNATLTQHEIAGDDIVQLTIGLQGFIEGDRKDVYMNFI